MLRGLHYCCSEGNADDDDFQSSSGWQNTFMDTEEEPIRRTIGSGYGSRSAYGSAYYPAKKERPKQWARGYEDEGLEERVETEVEANYTYQGQWKGDTRHGHGVLKRTDGIRYEGNFVCDQAHGRGKFEGPDGNSYDGQWDKAQMHGFGKYVDVENSTYEGEWAMNVKSGRGIEVYNDGARYEGEFLQGGKHGAGIYRGTGVEYEGHYADDQMHGEGRYTWADGRAYSGQWKNGHMQGWGKMTWPSGSKYEGGYDHDKKHGEGTFLWPDGQVYSGTWTDGQLDGPGTLVDVQGIETTQMWNNGVRTDELEAQGLEDPQEAPAEQAYEEEGYEGYEGYEGEEGYEGYDGYEVGADGAYSPTAQGYTPQGTPMGGAAFAPFPTDDNHRPAAAPAGRKGPSLRHQGTVDVSLGDVQD